MAEEGTKLVASNKKAYHDYFVDETSFTTKHMPSGFR